MEPFVFDLLKSFGPTVAAIGFFIWRDWKREQFLTTFIQDTLVDLLRDHKVLMTEVVETLRGCRLNQSSKRGDT